MSRKPVIFHIAKWYPNRHDNMLGLFVKRHILSTLPYTTPVVFYAMACPDVKSWYEIEVVNDEGILTYRCYYRKDITGIGVFDKVLKLFLYAFVILKMYKLAKVKTGKASLINAHILNRTAVMARLIEITDGVPYVLLEHASMFIRKELNAYPSFFSHQLAKHVVKHAKAVMTVSECLANGMKNTYGLFNEEYVVVYNSVDTSIFNRLETIKKIDKKQFVYIAEFDETSKNTKGLLNCIASLNHKRNDFVVDLIGYGKDEALLHKYADELGIKNKVVFFTGKLEAKQLVCKIQQSTALLLFSNFETLSCVITEALCCGIPVISTAVGGVVEIVNENSGILVPKGDEVAMENAMVALLNNEKHWNHKEISEKAIAKFSNEAVAVRIVNVYKKVLSC
jgi:glycosyltransferase involved in cell wall biosynthesis